jgi:lactoylglutathione lyase
MTMTDTAPRAAVEPGKARFLHTMLRVKDLDKSLRFYTELLGMKLLRKRDYPTGKFTLAFVGYGDETDSTVVELTHNWDQKEPYSLGSAFGHLAIGVPDVYKTCERSPPPGSRSRARPARWRMAARSSPLSRTPTATASSWSARLSCRRFPALLPRCGRRA